MKWLRPALTALSTLMVPALLLGTAGPAHAAASTLFGTTTTGAFKSTYEPVDMYRAFFSGAPGNWATDPKLNHGKPVNVSFKWTPATVLGGTVDTAFRTFLQTAPADRPVWWTYFHEPEDEIKRGDFTAADYRLAWQHLSAIAHESGVYKSNVKAALVLMDYTVDPASGRDWQDYYPGSAYIDVLSWDVYGFKETDADPANDETIQAHQLRRPSLSVTQAAGKPYAISEVGYDDAAGRPAFLTGLATWARDNNAVFVSYFDEIGGLGDHRLTDTASQSVWRDAASGALFAGPVTATDNPATGVTGNSATMSCRVDPHNGGYRVTVASWLTVGGASFVETPGVTVADGPETVSSTRTGLAANTGYTFRCKVYDTAGTLILKPPALTFTTLP
ncbi:glycoside hydrolase family 26 protein [Hamadaea tsunoensis]|uniref:hypothetical protein n=1 Tax=Hamadaea tsunoensis TaxID=53368 RepID=UPI00041072CF|nr:hypothetical protein [Hamadaea tsunoensis]